VTNPTVAYVCSTLKIQLTEDESLELVYESGTLRPDQNILEFSSEFEPMQCKMIPKTIKTFTFALRDKAITASSRSGALSSMLEQLQKNIQNRPYFIELAGERIAQEAMLDPRATYRIVLLSDHLTVKFQASGTDRSAAEFRRCDISLRARLFDLFINPGTSIFAFWSFAEAPVSDSFLPLSGSVLALLLFRRASGPS
jgi:hypothetical protein